MILMQNEKGYEAMYNPSNLSNDLAVSNFLILFGLAVITVETEIGIPDGLIKTIILGAGLYAIPIGAFLGFFAIIYYFTHKEKKNKE